MSRRKLHTCASAARLVDRELARAYRRNIDDSARLARKICKAGYGHCRPVDLHSLAARGDAAAQAFAGTHDGLAQEAVALRQAWRQLYGTSSTTGLSMIALHTRR